jgi:hypothetical protein
MEGDVLVSRRERRHPMSVWFTRALLCLVSVHFWANPAHAVTLTWDASTGGNVAGYRVYYGAGSRNYTNNLNVANQTAAAVTGLRPGIQYFFSVVAYNTWGIESEFSNEISFTEPSLNLPPTLNSISAVTIAEDSAARTVSLAGITSGSASENQTLVVTASSSNTGLIPNPTINYSSPASTGSLTFTPVPNANGSATITVTVSDGIEELSRTFTVTVTSVNDTPALNALSNLTIAEDSGAQTINLSGISSGANESQTLTVTASSSSTSLIPTPSVNYSSPASTGSLTFTPAANANGTATITVTVNDGSAQFSRSFTVTVTPVNDPPVLGVIADRTINQNAGLQTVSLSGISSGAANESQTLSVTASSSSTALIPNPTVTYSSPSATGSLRFTPVTGASGSATITVTVSDGSAQASRTFTVMVNSPSNQPPTINVINPVVVNEDAGAQTIALSGISGGASEVQTVTVSAVSSNPSLIPNPSVSYSNPSSTGSLTFTPAANASGSATITVTVNDGTLQATRSFAVTVNPVNDPPALNAISNVTIAEDAAVQTVNLSGISSGAANETQALTVTATSSNPALIPHPAVNYASPVATGSLNFAPVANASGSATITVTVSDGENQVNRTFTVTVTPVNDAPTLDAITDLGISEDAGQQMVSFSGITSGASDENQPLTVTVTSGNPALIPNPTVTYTSPSSIGSLGFTPVGNASGTATVIVTVNDGTAQFSRTFTITVNPENDLPTLGEISNVTLNENAGIQTITLSGISSGATNENQTLTVAASSSNPGLIPNPTVAYASPASTGSLSFTPLANSSGNAIVTVTVSDGLAQVSKTFVVIVNPAAGENNQPPTIVAPNIVIINEDAATQTVNLSGITSGSATENQTLTVTAFSSNPSLIPNPTVTYVSPSTSGSLSFAPTANNAGGSTVIITVSDGELQFSRTLTVVVNPVNDPPTVDAISNITIDEDSSQQTVNFTGVSTGATNENQSLTLTATSGNPGLIPHPIVSYSSPGTAGNLRFTPVANASGTATITLAINDGWTSSTRTFVVTVNPVNDAPTLNAVANRSAVENSGVHTVNLSGISSGASNEVQTLSLTASSSNPGLVSTPTVNYTSPGATGSISFTPAANATGSVVLTITVSDGQSQLSRSFEVTVEHQNEPPFISSIDDQSTYQTKSLSTISFSVSDRETDATNLTLSAMSSNPGLIPAENVRFGGTGTNRWFTLTPAAGQLGEAHVTILVSDGAAISSSSFRMGVRSVPTTSDLTLEKIGSGTLTGTFKTTNMAVGKPYSITATPAAGYIFAGWSGLTNSSATRLTFIMQPDAVLRATFIPNPYLPIAGSYNGLFYENEEVNQHSAGSITLTLTTKGSYTGKLQIGSSRLSLSGTLDINCATTNYVKRTGLTPLKLVLAFGTGAEADRVTGILTDGNWVSSVTADRAIYKSFVAPCPKAGKYTLVIPGSDETSPIEMGEGYGSLSVDASGSIRFTGALADGTKVTQSAKISKQGLWPVYIPLYTGKGSVLSWLTFTNQPEQDLTGVLSWIKLGGVKGAYYTNGFAAESQVVGSSYVAPAGTNVVFNSPSALVQFLGGNLATDFENEISIGSRSKVTNLGTNKMTLTFTTTSGTFKGTVTDPSSKASRRFEGAILQKQDTAYGFLLGVNQSSRVIISP